MVTDSYGSGLAKPIRENPCGFVALKSQAASSPGTISST